MSKQPETCGNCKFFVANSEGDRARCHQKPPVPVDLDTTIGWRRPCVSEGDWCGEWKPKGDSLFGVVADWLDENGHPDAAQHIREAVHV